MRIEIKNLGNKILNQYLIKAKNGYLLIDTGYPNGFNRFAKKLNNENLPLEQITHIFITHAHDDHVGFLGNLVSALPNAKVIATPETLGRLKVGHNLFIGGTTTKRAHLFCKFMSLLGNDKHEFPKLELKKSSILWNDKPDFLRSNGINADVIKMAGHTSDSIGLLFDNGYLFCGDAAMSGFPSKKNVIIFIESLDEYKQTWDNMIENQNIKKVFCGHGKPFDIGNLKKHRKFLDTIKLRPLKDKNALK